MENDTKTMTNYSNMEFNIGSLQNEVIRIAEKAGEEIMQVYSLSDFSNVVNFKSDDSPLTLADKNAHESIFNDLKVLAPEIPIISEEGSDVPYEERKNWKRFWMVDPLDGTKEFISRNNEFTVNIALVENDVPIFGVIYLPVDKIVYCGTVGKGAFKIEGGIKSSIQTNQKFEDLTAIGSRSHASSEESEMLRKYSVRNTVSAGSSLKFCRVAEGKADLYLRFNPTMEWDTAAGQAIVEAAGGFVADLDNNRFSYNKRILKNGSFLCVSHLGLLGQQ